MLAAQRAMAEGEYELAAQRLIYARDAEPENVAVLRLMTLAFWQAGKLDDGGARGARLGPRRRQPPAAHRFAARIYEDMGAVDLAEEAAARAAQRGPPTPAPGSASGACACACSTARGRSRRSGKRWRWERATTCAR